MSTGNGRKRNANKADEIRATDLRFQRGRLVVTLADAREISVPLGWYPSLERARPAQRSRWSMIGDGQGFHWPDLDLDLSVPGLANGLLESIPRPPRLPATAPARLPQRRSA